MPKCFECDGKGQHLHHVVPKVRGGTRSVYLCVECHEKAHHKDNRMSTPELIKEGIKRKRAAQGGKWGMSRIRNDEAILKLRIDGLSIRKIADILNVSSTTVARSIREEELKRKQEYLKENVKLPWSI